MNLVVVTGQFRTGTSAVSQILHRLGVPMAMAVCPPVYPDKRWDWECFDATMALNEIFPWDDKEVCREARNDFVEWFPKYLEHRMVMGAVLAKMYGHELHAIGVKCPVYALFIPEILKASQKAGIEQIVLIKTTRDAEDQARSIVHTYGRMNCIEHIKARNRLIGDMPVDATTVISLEKLKENPYATTVKLAKLVGADLTDWSRIEDAAGVIEQGGSEWARSLQRRE